MKKRSITTTNLQDKKESQTAQINASKSEIVQRDKKGSMHKQTTLTSPIQINQNDQKQENKRFPKFKQKTNNIQLKHGENNYTQDQHLLERGSSSLIDQFDVQTQMMNQIAQKAEIRKSVKDQINYFQNQKKRTTSIQCADQKSNLYENQENQENLKAKYSVQISNMTKTSNQSNINKSSKQNQSIKSQISIIDIQNINNKAEQQQYLDKQIATKLSCCDQDQQCNKNTVISKSDTKSKLEKYKQFKSQLDSINSIQQSQNSSQFIQTDLFNISNQTQEIKYSQSHILNSSHELNLNISLAGSYQSLKENILSGLKQNKWNKYVQIDNLSIVQLYLNKLYDQIILKKQERQQKINGYSYNSYLKQYLMKYSQYLYQIIIGNQEANKEQETQLKTLVKQIQIRQEFSKNYLIDIQKKAIDNKEMRQQYLEEKLKQKEQIELKVIEEQKEMQKLEELKEIERNQEEQRKQEEFRRYLQQMKEEELRLKEEELSRQEEALRRQEEYLRKKEEDLQKLKEDQRKQQEEQKRQLEEQRKQEEERNIAVEKRKLEEEQEQRKQAEVQRRKEEEQKKQEEERYKEKAERIIEVKQRSRIIQEQKQQEEVRKKEQEQKKEEVQRIIEVEQRRLDVEKQQQEDQKWKEVDKNKFLEVSYKQQLQQQQELQHNQQYELNNQNQEQHNQILPDDTQFNDSPKYQRQIHKNITFVPYEQQNILNINQNIYDFEYLTTFNPFQQKEQKTQITLCKEENIEQSEQMIQEAEQKYTDDFDQKNDSSHKIQNAIDFNKFKDHQKNQILSNQFDFKKKLEVYVQENSIRKSISSLLNIEDNIESARRRSSINNEMLHSQVTKKSIIKGKLGYSNYSIQINEQQKCQCTQFIMRNNSQTSRFLKPKLKINHAKLGKSNTIMKNRNQVQQKIWSHRKIQNNSNSKDIYFNKDNSLYNLDPSDIHLENQIQKDFNNKLSTKRILSAKCFQNQDHSPRIKISIQNGTYKQKFHADNISSLQKNMKIIETLIKQQQKYMRHKQLAKIYGSPKINITNNIYQINGMNKQIQPKQQKL